MPTAHSASSVASCLYPPTLPLLGAEAQGLARPLLPHPATPLGSGQPRSCLALLIPESHRILPGLPGPLQGQLRACSTHGLGQGHFCQALIHVLPLFLPTSTAALLPALLKAVGCLASPSQLGVSEGPKQAGEAPFPDLFPLSAAS